MLILAFVGWVIAYAVKVVLRSILQLVKFDKFSENTGASQLLAKAALPSAAEILSRFVFWVTWLGFILLGVSVLGILGLQEQVARFFLFLPRLFAAMFILFFGTAGRQLLFSRRSVGGRECESAFRPACQPGRPHHHCGFCILCGFRRAGHCRTNHAGCLRNCLRRPDAWAGHRIRNRRPRFSAAFSGREICSWTEKKRMKMNFRHSKWKNMTVLHRSRPGVSLRPLRLDLFTAEVVEKFSRIHRDARLPVIEKCELTQSIAHLLR